MGVHLDVHRGSHRLLFKRDVEIHLSIELEGLLVIGPWYLVGLLKIMLLQSGHGGNFLEQDTSND